MRLTILAVSLVCLLLSATASDGSPIFTGGDPGSFYDLTLSVEQSMTIVPGHIGFLSANIFNTGTLPISFKTYDASNPIGGFGWNFDDPGFAIGTFAVGKSTDQLKHAFGHVDSVVPNPFSCCVGSNFSHLNGVVIQPGQGLVFDLMSIAFDAGVASGTNATLSTSIQLHFGSPIFAGFTSESFVVSIVAGNTAADGPLAPVALQNFASPMTPVPEPGTMTMIGLGLAYVAQRRFRQRR